MGEFVDPAIERAIDHGVRAGKLRAFARRNGGEFKGLQRLADRQSARVTEILNGLYPPRPPSEDAW
jgi:hypothetical protein